MHRRRILPALVLILVLLAGGYLAWSQLGQTDSSGNLKVSGTIEADEAVVSAEVAGRVKEIKVEEGDAVKQGDVVVLVDDALLQAKLKEAEAATEVARAKLAQIKAGAGDEAIAVARATLLQAQAAQQGADTALQDVKAIRDNPQELNAKIDAAQAQVAAASASLDQAVASKDSAAELKDATARAADTMENGIDVTVNVGGKQIQRTITFGPELAEKARLDRTLASDKWWAAWEQVNLAQAQKEAAEVNLRNLNEMKDQPLQADAEVGSAEARYREAVAASSAANAQLTALLNGATPEDLSLAQAQVEQAETAANLLRVQQAKTALTSPITGVVSNRSINLGEMAALGVPLVSVANLDRLTLTVYVPEGRIGQVQLGQRVAVTADSYPGEEFAGEVSYLSDTAEFTPKNVQTANERVNTVYAVKIRLDNSTGKLKPGMPADARIEVTQ